MTNTLLICVACLLAGTGSVMFAEYAAAANTSDQTPDELVEQGQRALLQRKFREAAELATKAIEQKPDLPAAFVLRGRARQRLGQLDEAIGDLTQAVKLKPSAEAHLIRGECHSALDRHKNAIADFDRTLELEPRLHAAYHHRGRERFKNGEIEKSIADFDKMIELEPAHENECWERGLSRYYAGQFALAQKSFEDYHKVGPRDIENGLWRMISQAEVAGLPAAQKDLLKYDPKERPPFPLAYDLYAGQSKPEFVIEHALDGATDETDKKTRTFYAHLYVGLWFVASHDRPAATAHLEKAAALRSTDYMWYVAREQLKRLKAEPSGKQ